MRKFKLFFACLLMAVLSIGQMWGEDATFSGWSYSSGSITGGTLSGAPTGATASLTTTYTNANQMTKNNYQTLTLSGFDGCTVTGVTVHVKTNASKGGGTGTLTINGESKGSLAQTGVIGGTYTDKAFTVTSTEVLTGGTIQIVLTASANSLYCDKYTVTYTAAGGGDTPPTPKTLESVSVSGTPTKTSYFAGQDFDPAGLTVTGHYSDDTNAEITSDITWSYNPAQELAENQTSINVKATVSDITSVEWYEVSGLTVAAGPDVFIDLVDAGWGFPTDYVVNETSYTNGGITIKLAGGTTGSGFKLFPNSNIILGKQDAYLELPAFASPIARIVVAGNSGGSGKVTWNIFKGNAAVSTAVTGCKNEAYTFNIDPLEANVVYRLKVTNDNNLQIKNIKIYFGEVPVVAKPSISGETPFLNSTNVSISIPEGTTVYYTTDGSDPKTAGTQYSAAFDLNNSATVKAIATDGVNWSEVAEKAFTKATIMTVAQARAAIDANPSGIANQYVAGTISKIDSYSSTYKSITYWISDDGTTTNQLQVYSGLAGVVKDHFESKDDLNVGDDVTVKGTLKLHNNSVYEFDYDNTIVIYKTTAQLAWSASSYNASLEGENTFPTLTNTNDVTVTYSSSDPEKAEINETTGAITLKAVGTVTITATFAGNETYKANAVSYEMSIASSLVTLTYNVDGGETIDPVNVNALPNPLPTTTKAGFNFGGWFTDSEKTDAAVPGAPITENTTLFAKWLDPYTVAEAKAIIDATPAGTENQYVAGIISKIDSYNSTYKSITYWISADGTKTNQLEVYGGLIGNAATALGKETFTTKEDLKLGDQVVVKGTLKKYNSTYEFDKDNIIYSFNRPAPKYTVRFWNTAEGWSSVNAHVWNNDGNVTTWPGEATTFKAGWNEFEVEEGNSLLFCKEDGTAQTVDITNVTADACYVLTGTADGSGHLEVDLDTECAARFYVAGNTELTGLDWNAAGSRLVNGAITFTNVPAGDHQFKVTNGSWNWERGYLAFDSENSNVTNWGDNNVGFTTTSAKDITIAYDEANNKITVTTVDYVEPTYKAIVVAYGDKYYAMTTNFDGGGFTPLAVKVDANGNVLVQTEAERNSILWKYTAGTETATFQDANNQYLAKVSGTTLQLSEEFAEWTWSSEGGYYYALSDRTLLYQASGNIFKNYATSNASKTGYSDLPVFYESAKVIVSNTATLKFFAPVAWGENVYAYSWGGSDNGDHQMTAVEEGSRWFQCEIEKGVQFLFYKGNGDWSVQTKDLEAINADKCFAWTPATDDGKIVTTEITSCEMNYFISGDEALTGVAEWGHKALAANNTVAFSEVTADTYHFKITNGSWEWNLGAAYLDANACENVTIEETDANGNVVFTIDNPSDITIAYNPATEKISIVATAVTPKEYYTKVTSTENLTAGYYLIVSEDNLLEEHVALNGGLSTLDATNNVIDVEIVTGKGIEVTEATNAAAFFIDPEIGTIKSASEQFIGLTGTANALKQNENIYAYENAFSFDANGNAVIICGSKKLCYNPTSGQNRFRYFTNDQQAIQLYKKAEVAKASPELAFAESAVETIKGNDFTAPALSNEHNVTVTYKSSAGSRAEVDEASGVVTIKAAGEVTIYAVTAGDETYRESYAKYTITINDFGSYTRPVTPDNYGTICLPKAGVMTGATLFEIADFSNGMIYVDEVNGGAMEAGKPYIFQATSEQLNVVYTSATVEETAGENNGLHGFYNLTNEDAQFDIPADAGNYILYQNQYWLVSGRAAYIANYRAYIRVSEINYVAPAPGRRRVAMNVNGEQTATGINELNAAEAPVKMIMNGQLYILRGEKLYDATGRLVK